MFAEALTSLADCAPRDLAALDAPVLVEHDRVWGDSLLTLAELGDAGVAVVLYPLSASRAAARASERIYAAIRRDGTQAGVLDEMQTRDELYEVLDYLRFEAIIE